MKTRVVIIGATFLDNEFNVEYEDCTLREALEDFHSNRKEFGLIGGAAISAEDDTATKEIMCKYHNSPMQPSKTKQGEFYCPRKIPNTDTFCDYVYRIGEGGITVSSDTSPHCIVHTETKLLPSRNSANTLYCPKEVRKGIYCKYTYELDS